MFGNNEFLQFWARRRQEHRQPGLHRAEGWKLPRPLGDAGAGARWVPRAAWESSAGSSAGSSTGSSPHHNAASCTAGGAAARSSSAAFVPRPRCDVLEASSKRRANACVSSAPARAAQPATPLARALKHGQGKEFLSDVPWRKDDLRCQDGPPAAGLLPRRAELCRLGISLNALSRDNCGMRFGFLETAEARLSARQRCVSVTHRPACALSEEQLLKAIGSFS